MVCFPCGHWAPIWGFRVVAGAELVSQPEVQSNSEGFWDRSHQSLGHLQRPPESAHRCSRKPLEPGDPRCPPTAHIDTENVREGLISKGCEWRRTQ